MGMHAGLSSYIEFLSFVSVNILSKESVEIQCSIRFCFIGEATEKQVKNVEVMI